MSVKRIIGSHFANYREAWQANRLIGRGAIHPTLSVVHPLSAVGEAAAQVHRNEHAGKVGVLALAPRPGLGVTDPELRERHTAALQRFQAPEPVPGPAPQ
jgi:crotonyl-CoA reductase